MNKRVVYYTLQFPLIIVGGNFTLKKTFPNSTVIQGIFLENTFRYTAEINDVRNQQLLGELASKVNLLNGYRFSNKLGTDLDITVRNYDAVAINPSVIIETYQEG